MSEKNTKPDLKAFVVTKSGDKRCPPGKREARGG